MSIADRGGPKRIYPEMASVIPYDRPMSSKSDISFLSQNGRQAWVTRDTLQQKTTSYLKIKNEYIRLFLAEFIGTFLLVSVGLAANAQAILSNGAEGNTLTKAIGWGVAVAMGVYASGGVSGGHINPAVTTAMTFLGRLSFRKMPFYILGQYTGALFGSLAVYVVYLESLWKYAGDERLSPSDMDLRNETASIWATFPKSYVAAWEGLLDQTFVTALLVTYVMAVTDERNMGTPKGVVPLVLGLGITGLLTGFMSNCGAALNPARDLAPRVFTAISGWGAGPFSFRAGNWFWIPILGPHIGAVLGALFYNICIGLHWPATQQEAGNQHHVDRY